MSAYQVKTCAQKALGRRLFRAILEQMLWLQQSDRKTGFQGEEIWTLSF